MIRTALINIDTQQSFEHRSFWQTGCLDAFPAAILTLINGCQQRDIPVIDISHAAASGPAEIFMLASDAFRLHYTGPNPQVPTSIGITMGAAAAFPVACSFSRA